MVKIARDVAERLLLICLHLKSRGHNCYGILEESWGKKQTFKSNVVLRNIYNDGLASGGPWTEWPEFSAHLQEQLVGSPSTSHHPTLIDIIVDLLQAPYARNAISGRNLQQLRRAVLLPEEMIKFGESVRKEMGCAGCGKRFVKGEMASFHTEADEGSAFYCTRCTIPTVAACRSGDGHCEGAGELDSKHLTKTLQNRNCGDHNPAPSAKDTQEADRVRRELEALAQPQWVDVGQAQAPPQPQDAAAQHAQNPFIPDVGHLIDPAPVPPGFRAERRPDGGMQFRRVDAQPARGAVAGVGVRMPPWRQEPDE